MRDKTAVREKGMSPLVYSLLIVTAIVVSLLQVLW
jgi:hypothetical protein|tara:strand:- start:13273 stop:13377 length:105 start_codon:yes stop_codon:yes gene_type:complete